MAGLEDVEAWLDASDKNGVSVAIPKFSNPLWSPYYFLSVSKCVWIGLTNTPPLLENL